MSNMSEAFLLISYGAPCCESDVVPFLGRLLGDRVGSEGLMEKAAMKYYEFAGRNGEFSPLNEQCRELLRGVGVEFCRVGLPTKIYHGNLYWRPFLEDTIAQMAEDGVTSAKCFITSAFDSTAGNRRYSYAIDNACKKIGETAPVIERLPLPFDQPLFIESQAERLCEAIDGQKDSRRRCVETLIFFTAHSIPQDDPFAGNYVEQLNFACRAVIEKCRSIRRDLPNFEWELVYQSQPISQNKNNNQTTRWLSPSIKSKISTLVEQSKSTELSATKNIIISPIGFFCENMETINDLDFELGDICAGSSIELTRVLTVGTMPKIYEMIVQLCGKKSE
jgi:ferrochelatase